jgi:hypothetical protein
LKYKTNLEEKEDSLDVDEDLEKNIEQKEREDYVSFLKFDQLNFMTILETCAAALDILFLSFGEIDSKYEYKGHLFYEGKYYMFFDCSEYQISTHNLNKQNDIWLTLVDEIINYQMVCQFKIDDKVSHFFLNHQEYIKLEQLDSNPIIYYDGNFNRFNGAPYICETPGSFRFNIEILLDKNSVEGYIDHGKLHIVEALKNPKSDQGLELKGDIKVHSFEVAEMKSIWK